MQAMQCILRKHCMQNPRLAFELSLCEAIQIELKKQKKRPALRADMELRFDRCDKD